MTNVAKMTENFVFGKVTVIFWYCDIHRNRLIVETE